MEYIKEPKGVDFVIQSEPLTEEAKAEISNFIKNYKLQNASNKLKIIKTTAKNKLQTV